MKSQTDPSARCDECGHPYSEERKAGMRTDHEAERLDLSVPAIQA